MNYKINFVDKKIHILLLNLVGIIGLVLLLPLIVSLFLLNNYFYYLIAFLSIIFITKVGQAIGQHRFFSHKSFLTNNIVKNILAIFATLSCTGTVIHYAAIHRAHHRSSDTEDDPHSPHHNGFIKTWFANLDKDVSKKIPKKIVLDLMKDNHLRFFHSYYWLVILSYNLILCTVDPWLILYAFLLPVGYSRFCTGLQATISHQYGYRNFDTRDNSTNSLLINVLTLGEGSHNNHHYRQYEYNFGFTGDLKEFDLSAFIIKYCLRGHKNDVKFET